MVITRTLSQYQRVVAHLVMPEDRSDLEYSAIRLGGEAGEVLNQIAKHLRELKYNVPVDTRMERIEEEIGDTLYCLARVCIALELDFDLVGERNLLKMKERKTNLTR